MWKEWPNNAIQATRVPRRRGPEAPDGERSLSGEEDEAQGFHFI